ncbi:MAG: PQQ-binding-like beta-propeller repeat protein [bacterium]
MKFRMYVLTVFVMLLVTISYAAPGPWVVALDKEQDVRSIVVVLQEQEGKLTGEVYLSQDNSQAVSADVTKLTRTDDTLKGVFTVKLSDTVTGTYTLEGAVKDNVLTGTYAGTTGEEKVNGTLTWGADLLPMGHALFVPSSRRVVGWRGDGSGRFPAATPVTTWDLKTKKNLIWQTKLPFISTSGPIVVGDRVFTTGEPDYLICVDANTGKELWRRHTAIHMEKIPETERERLYANCDALLEVAEKWLPMPAVNEDGQPVLDMGEVEMVWAPTKDARKMYCEKSIQLLAPQRGIDLAKVRAMYAEVGTNDKVRASALPNGALLCTTLYSWTGNMPATPTSDGKYVVTRVSSINGWGYLVCFDMEGNRKWSVDTGKTGAWGCPYDSPLISGKVVITQSTWVKGIDLRGKPFDRCTGFIAYDLESGKQVWQMPGNGGCSSPIPVTIDGIKLVFFGGKVFVAETGLVVLDLNELYSTDVDTPVVQGDLLFFRGKEGKTLANAGTTGRACRSHILKLAWKEKGKELQYEIAWKSADTDKFILTSNWIRGSSIMLDGWIFISKGTRNPVLFAFNTKTQHPTDNIPFVIGVDPALLVLKPPQKKGEKVIRTGPPYEDDMSVVMGGKYIYACPSTWPSQFVVVEYSPTAKITTDLKAVAAPVVNSALMGSPFFQGNRMYVRDYSYLYCFGDPDQQYQSPLGGK